MQLEKTRDGYRVKVAKGTSLEEVINKATKFLKKKANMVEFAYIPPEDLYIVIKDARERTRNNQLYKKDEV